MLSSFRCHLLDAVLAAAVALSIGCGASPSAPPPVVANPPPTIESLTIASARAEADRDVQVTASVKDAETPAAELTYAWSASPKNGVFTGTGATVTWRPPKGETTPDQYTITLTVTERFTSAGQAKQNVVSSSATVAYNDSPAETIGLAVQFLTDYGTYETTAEYCVRNFSDSCRGKAKEQQEIEEDREDVRIFSAGFTAPPAALLNGALTQGSVRGPCEFIDTDKSGPFAGRKRSVKGTCILTTVYQDGRWYLCDSFLESSEKVFLTFRERHRITQ